MADEDNLPDIVLAGKSLRAVLGDAHRAGAVTRTLSGAATVSLTVHDPDRKLSTSRVFAERVPLTVDRAVFDLVAVTKNGSDLDLVFEDAVVADLRTDRTKPGQPTPSAKPGTTTVDAFARRLVGGAPGAKLVAFGGQRNLDTLIRGTSSDRYEDSWSCLQRLADERGWRCFTDRGTVFLGPETWLLTRQRKTPIYEYRNGVEVIDWDFDQGKRAGRANFRVAASRWQFGPGAPITVHQQGLGSGDWLVEEVTRDLFGNQSDVTLIRAQKPLPEPKPEPRENIASSGPAAAGGGTAVRGPVSAKGFAWPLSGTITSGFGQRGGRLHAGLDIACKIGTPVGACADGVVEFAGTAGGYGTAIYLRHAAGVITRYGHLSRLSVRAGQRVDRGEVIGLSGNTGNSTGPHLHLEVRPGNTPVDPLTYLPSRR